MVLKVIFRRELLTWPTARLRSPPDLFSPNFGAPTTFMDPRRAMVGLRVNFGR